MGCSLLSIFYFAAIGLTAFGLGQPLLRWTDVADDDRLSSVAFGTGLGLAAAGAFLLLLGRVGILYLPLIGLLTMLGCCWGLVEVGLLCLRSDGPSGKEWSAPSPTAWPNPPRWLVASILAAAAIVCAAALLGALAPPTSQATLSGQLEAAKRFLIEHRVTRSGVRPLMVEMWYLWAVALDGGVCAQLVHWGLGILLALAAVGLATPLLGRSWAWLVGGLVVLTPVITRQMSLPAGSVAMAAFSTLALAAGWQAVIHGGDRRWFVVAGLMAGAALGIDYSAALLLPAFGIPLAWAALHRVEQRRFLLQGGATATLLALGLGAACSIPALWPEPVAQASDPRVPFAGTNGVEEELDAGRVVCDAVARHPLISAWDVKQGLGVILLAAVPGLLLTRRLRGLGAILSAAAVYGLFALVRPAEGRLLCAAVPLLSVAAVWVWIELLRFPPTARRLATAVFAVMALCSTAMSLVRSADAWPVAVGFEDREDYLFRHEPTYRAAAVANQMCPNARLLSQERGSFYFDCRVTCQTAPSPLIDSKQPASSVRDTMRQLHQAGITHVLLAETASDPAAVSRLPSDRLRDVTVPLTDYCFRTADGSVRHYRLMALR
jgi:hypothetical protein